MATGQDQEPIVIVLAGKAGAGKTTLFNTLLNEQQLTAQDPNSVTDAFYTSTITRNGVSISVTDTPGLKDTRKEKKMQLKELSCHTKGNADILLYCVTIGPGHRFETANPVTMKCLTDAFGKKLWQHCTVVFTFSNLAFEHYKNMYTDIATAEEKYRELIEKYADAFQTELSKKLKVRDMTVTTIFTVEHRDPNTIIAIPAGLNISDPVLPGMHNTNWKEVILDEMSKCNPKYTQALLKYRFGAIKSTAGGISVGVAAGTGIGATVGIVGGPIGVVVGGLAGGIVGGALGGAAVGGVLYRSKYKVERAVKLKNVETTQNESDSFCVIDGGQLKDQGQEEGGQEDQEGQKERRQGGQEEGGHGEQDEGGVSQGWQGQWQWQEDQDEEDQNEDERIPEDELH